MLSQARVHRLRVGAHVSGIAARVLGSAWSRHQKADVWLCLGGSRCQAPVVLESQAPEDETLHLSYHDGMHCERWARMHKTCTSSRVASACGRRLHQIALH